MDKKLSNLEDKMYTYWLTHDIITVTDYIESFSGAKKALYYSILNSEHSLNRKARMNFEVILK